MKRETMLDRLIEHVLGLPDEQLRAQSLQDMAICRAWHASFGSRLDESQHKLLEERIAVWLGLPPRQDLGTEGRRHQWVMRDLIKMLRRSGLDTLDCDEVAFLHAVHQLIGQAGGHQKFSRVHMLIGPHGPVLNDFQEAAAPTPGLSGIAKRLNVLTIQDLLAAPRREVRLFAGILMPFRGPVLSLRGHIKVLQDVPEECTLVAEDGSCSVEGYVRGRVAARDSCDVRENITGAVVVRLGDVRARNIVEKAYVVSKWGNIYCRRCQNPKLVFAGKALTIAEYAALGRYFAPRMHVCGELRGGMVNVSNGARAERFVHTDERPVRIVLRRELTCADYGEKPGPDAGKLLRHADSCRRRLETLGALITTAEQEVESCANNAICFIFGDMETQQRLERLGYGRRKHHVIECMLAWLKQHIALAEEYDQHSASAGEAAAKNVMDADDAMLDIKTELEQLKTEDHEEPELRIIFDELCQIEAKLTRGVQDKARLTRLIYRMRALLNTWQAVQQDVHQDNERDAAHFHRILANVNLQVEDGSELSRAELLKRILTSPRAQGESEALERRLQSGFMRIMLRTMRNRAERAKQLRTTQKEVRRDLQETSRVLRDEHYISVPESARADIEATVEGRFTDSVGIYAGAYALTEDAAQSNAAFQTEDSGTQVRRFIRSAAGGIEERREDKP